MVAYREPLCGRHIGHIRGVLSMVEVSFQPPAEFAAERALWSKAFASCIMSYLGNRNWIQALDKATDLYIEPMSYDYVVAVNLVNFTTASMDPLFISNTDICNQWRYIGVDIPSTEYSSCKQ